MDGPVVVVGGFMSGWLYGWSRGGVDQPVVVAGACDWSVPKGLEVVGTACVVCNRSQHCFVLCWIGLGGAKGDGGDDARSMRV